MVWRILPCGKRWPTAYQESPDNGKTLAYKVVESYPYKGAQPVVHNPCSLGKTQELGHNLPIIKDRIEIVSMPKPDAGL